MEKQNQEKYNEKEKKLIKDFMEEINRNTKNNENLKIENEKLKYDYFNQKTDISKLNNRISELEYENKDNIEKKNREINKLKEQLNFMERELNEKDLQIKNNLTKTDNNILKFKTENNSLIQQINDLNQKNKDYILEIMELKHNIEMINNDMTQSELALKNKDSVIEQLRNQINEMNSEIDEKMNDLQVYEENKQKERDDYNNKIEELLQIKDSLEKENNELSHSLAEANETLKEYNDVIINKYKFMEEELYKEQQARNNMEQKYKEKIQSLKIKYNNLQQENNKFKDMIFKNKKDLPHNFQRFYTTNTLNNRSNYNVKTNNNNNIRNKINIRDLVDVDSHINRTMFDMNTGLNKDLYLDKNPSNTFIQPEPYVNTFNPYNKGTFMRINNSKNDILENSLSSQNKIINEFKSLLNKIDEKLEIGKNK
jgi:predicted RNase H-like nuclease (RuvC/YqgF family)